MKPRSLSAALAVVAALVACQATAPQPARPEAAVAEPPAPLPSAEPSALAASASASGPSELAPYSGWMLNEDAKDKLPERAWLTKATTLRVHASDPDPFPDGYDSFASPRQVIVAEQSDKKLRVVLELSNVRLLLWASSEAFEPVPGKPVRMGVKPGVYPQGPEKMEGRDEVGVWLSPGLRTTAMSRKEGWREVKIVDDTFEAHGWLDESLLGAVFTPAPIPTITRHARVLTGARLLASPQGPVLATFPLSSGGPPQLFPWIEELGPGPPGFHQVLYAGHDTWARGLVAAGSFRPPEYGVGYGRGGRGRISGSRRKKMPPLVLTIDAGSDLLDAPKGEVVGRIRNSFLLPDRIERQSVSGYRQIEVPADELGLLKLWVDETRVRTYVPPPPASASASTSASASARR